jgi:putative aldouronate transport system substrate-binding protein
MKKIRFYGLTVFFFVLGIASIFGGGRQGAQAGRASGGASQVSSDKPLSLTLAVWEVNPFGGDAIAEEIQKKLNIEKIDIIPLDWGTYETQLQLWASSNAMPDAVGAYPMSSSWFGDFVAQEVIKNIPYEMAAKYPHVKNLFDNNSTFKAAKDIYKGNWYLPRPLSVTDYRVGDNPGIYYRKDWALKLGFKDEPTDMEYFYEMVKAFTKNDPDGNGRNDTFGIVGSFNTLYSFFDAFPWMWVTGPDGKVIPGYLNEKPMLEALAWLRRAYSEGIIDPELTTNANIVQEKFAQGIFGSLVSRPVGASWYTTIAVDQWGGANPGKQPLENVHVIAAMSAKPGGQRYHIPATDSSGTLFPYNISDEKLDRFLALSEYLHTDGYLLCNLGFEGVDYTRNPDGSFKALIDQTINQKYPSSTIMVFAFWNYDFGQFHSPFYSKTIQDYTTEWQKTANETALKSSVNILANMMSTPEKRDFVFDYNTYLTEIITGSGDIAAMYRRMVQDAYTNGVQRVIDSVNKAVGK